MKEAVIIAKVEEEESSVMAEVVEEEIRILKSAAPS
jgi:hypothetical protein